MNIGKETPKIKLHVKEVENGRKEVLHKKSLCSINCSLTSAD